MKCPKCQHDNPEGAKFCNECANKLEIACPECGNTNPPGSKFCNECAFNLLFSGEKASKDLSFDEKLDKIQRYLPRGLTEKILSQRDRIEGEQKNVTVMFCDMEGFTALSDKLTPEDAYSLMDQVYEILIHKVHDYGGTVNEMTGDGIMALFGAPIALEDAPQLAIRSAISIHREMVKFSDKIKQNTPVTLDLKMRIGIHTGPVVVGTLGNDLRVEFKAVGDTVNLASRMEGLAVPGTTYVTEDTFRLTEGIFRFEGLGERTVKGKEMPIKVFRVIAPSTRRTRFDVNAERGLTAFVGRERELDLLLEGFERAKAGRGQAFSIVAEAGLGKSRLLYEFRKAIINEDVTFLEGKCLSYSKGVAYHPIIDVLRSNFVIHEGDDDSEIKDKVKEGFRKLDIDEYNILPYILELLSVKDSGIDQIAISPEAKKAKTIESLRQIVLKGSEKRPLILAIEDLHWIDNSSEESLKYLLKVVPGENVFLILTYRPEFIHTWGGKSFHSQVTLNRLSNRESLAMLSHFLGTEDIDTGLEELVLEKTDGVPFFIEEFVRSLKDLDLFDIKDGIYFLAEGSDSLSIPSRIQDVIMVRVDALPEGVKEVLQIASVIGREFDHKLLQELIEFPEDKLLSHLSILKDAELIYERGIYPLSIYIFKHALTQETVYRSLLKSTSKKYHRIIAEAIEQHIPDIAEAQPEILSHHFTEAGLAENSIPYWQKAGEIAVRRSANTEAIVHFTKGLEVLQQLPESPRHNRQELSLQIALGVPLKVTKGYGAPEVEQTYLRAQELCLQLSEMSQLFSAKWGLWLFYLTRREVQKARALGDQLLDLANQLKDPALLLEAHHTLWTTLLFIGEFASTKKHVDEGMTLYDPLQHLPHVFLYAGHDSRLCGMSTASTVLWYLGYPDQALQKGKEALHMAEEIDHAFSLAHTLSYMARVHMLRGEKTAVRKLTERIIEMSTTQGFAQRLASAQVLQNCVSEEKRDNVESIARLRKSINCYRAAGAELLTSEYLALLAEAYYIAGQPKKGLTVLNESLLTVDESGVRFHEAELYRLKGELLLMKSPENQREAEYSFNNALKIGRQQEAKSLELRAAISLSRLWKNQGKTIEAQHLLSEIYNWFTEGFDTQDLKEAKALLEKLST